MTNKPAWARAIPAHLLQESAFRGASEKLTSISETAANHLKAQQANAELAETALSELTAARTAATDANRKLTQLSNKMHGCLQQFEGVLSDFATDPLLMFWTCMILSLARTASKLLMGRQSQNPTTLLPCRGASAAATHQACRSHSSASRCCKAAR